MWGALVTPLAGRTEKWWGSVMGVGLDPELTKWSVRSGPAIVLTGKGYKEHHWLAVPPSTAPVISTSPSLALLYHANVCSYYPWDSRPVRKGPCRRPCPRSSWEPHQRREGYYSLHVQRGRILRKSTRARRNTCTEFNHSMHVTRRVESILLRTTSTVIPTPMIPTRTASRIYTGPTSST